MTDAVTESLDQAETALVAAMLSGNVDLVDGGQPVTATLTWTREWRRRDGRWQVVVGRVAAAG